MEVKSMECERVVTKEDSIHSTIVFTAGTFLLMVCLKCFLVEQWRAWVFLVLNVILLAILFMSKRPGYWDQSSESENNVEEVKNDDKKENETSTHVHVENETEEEDEEEEEEQVELLSKEELNERVEAFIAMFRKHLISDVKQAENFRLHKTVNFRTKIEVPCY